MVLRDDLARVVPTTMVTDKAINKSPSFVALESEWLPSVCVMPVASFADDLLLTATEGFSTS